jgi:hypothetical protein
MRLRVVQGDVLDAKADVLIVTAATEPPKKKARRTNVFGSIGNRLVKRIGVEAAEELGDQLDLPVRSGDVQILDLEPDSGVAFKHVYVLGSLSEHKSALGSALADALRRAREDRAHGVALCLPKGGWRITKVDAVAILVAACDQCPEVDVTLYCLTSVETSEVSGLVRTFGIR